MVRSVPDEVDWACERGGGPLRFADLWRACCQGEGQLFVGDEMHGSVILTDDGVEIFHVYAEEWNDDEARWLLKSAAEFAKYHGRTVGIVTGRAGWRRFLRMRNLKLREI